MRISNNQQQTSFKQNIIMRLPEGMRSGSPVIQRIAEQTGQIAKNCAELVVPLKEEGFVLVSDRTTASGKLLNMIYTYASRLAGLLGNDNDRVREVDELLRASCDAVEIEARLQKAVFDSAGKPVDF